VPEAHQAWFWCWPPACPKTCACLRNQIVLAAGGRRQGKGDVGMRVRRLESRDRDAWRRLFAAYIGFYRAEVPDAVIELTWQRMMRGGDGEPIGLLAVDESNTGFGFAHLVMHRSTWSPTWYCYLEDLFVDPARRSNGAGRALIEAVYREADAHGCTRTYWVTEEDNARARMLYERVAVRAPFVQYRR
jgi:GNAT superfamily N-acetyltransferase